MHKFQDANGREWAIQLNTIMTKRVRKELGIDLLKMDEKLVTELSSNDEILVDVVSFICSEQIENENSDADHFAAGLIGDALDDAWEALISEVIFISRRDQREVITEAWEQTKKAQKQWTEKALAMLDSGIVEEKVDKAIEEMQAQFEKL